MSLSEIPALPTDPTTGLLPAGIFDGPYGYLVAIAFFAFLAMRELRRYRELDVAGYRTEVTDLKDDVAQLRAEVAESRQSSIDGAREAATRDEAHIREIAGLRAITAEHGIDTSSVPSSLTPPPPSTPPSVSVAVAVE